MSKLTNNRNCYSKFSKEHHQDAIIHYEKSKLQRPGSNRSLKLKKYNTCANVEMTQPTINLNRNDLSSRNYRSYSQPDVRFIFHRDNTFQSSNDIFPPALNTEMTKRLNGNQVHSDNLEQSESVTKIALPYSTNSLKETDAAQKFFAESGILGPFQSMKVNSDLIRKTSRVLQDPHVIEQIRKSSIIMRKSSGQTIKRASTIAGIHTSNDVSGIYNYEELSSPRSPRSPLDVNVNDFKIENIYSNAASLKDTIRAKDNEILKLKREINKLKSVLNRQSRQMENSICSVCQYEVLPKISVSLNCNHHHDSVGDRAGNVQHFKLCPESSTGDIENGRYSTEVVHAVGAHQSIRVFKKQGVSAESCEPSLLQHSMDEPIPKFEKDFKSKQLIKDAIMDNDFLKNIDASLMRELFDSMYLLSIAKGEFVIREGEFGAHLYVSAEGEFEVVQNAKVLNKMGPGKAFGELAILYNCTRTASVRVLTDARLWVLDRRVFQQIMMRTGLQRIENSVNFLKSVPLLKNLSEELLTNIADVLEVEFYPAGTYIIRQGAAGDTFFLISQGSVKVTQRATTSEETELRTLDRGDYFGEQALINEDKRTANIIALPPGVECLTLDRESFLNLIGDLCELKEKNYNDHENHLLAKKNADMSRQIYGSRIKMEFADMKLSDLEVLTTLGIGAFGRVELVKDYRQNITNIYALKCLKKQRIVATKQEEHVFNERSIMLACDSPFICLLHRTFRDDKYVYMLLEACMGGEIWTMLRDRGPLNENEAQFIIGCVLHAFNYLHIRGIIYRDLKPENLMLDQRGFVKLVDFGFAKYIGISNKTWTFCGTPEYVAPEIILNKGHDRAVDYWALGILIHELLNGAPPFTSNDPMKTYNQILTGIDMINFPKHISRSAVQLIKKLCRVCPAERLGYQKGVQDIKKHKWFLGFDWPGLENQDLSSPFCRTLAHATDTRFFDKFPSEQNEPPDEISGWDLEF